MRRRVIVLAPYPTLLTVGLICTLIYVTVGLVRHELAERDAREANRRRALGTKGRAR